MLGMGETEIVDIIPVLKGLADHRSRLSDHLHSCTLYERKDVLR